MPHGTQWSYDELRNAEKMAKIQAQAIVEAQRKEAERQRKAARATPPSRSSPQVQIQVVERVVYRDPPLTPWQQAQIEKQEDEASVERVRHRLAKRRATNAMAATFGTAPYIEARYGYKTWTTKIAELKEKFGCTEQEAIDYIVATYTEDSWKSLEDSLTEEYMGHRR